MERESAARPTLADLTGDHAFGIVARNNWLSTTPQKVLPDVVEKEIWLPLERDDFSQFSLLLLEQLQTLERYLWPGFTENATDHHVLLLILLVNVKRQEDLPAWTIFADRPDDFSTFFRRALALSVDKFLSSPVRTRVLTFLVGAFQSLDNGLLRRECAPLVSVGIWYNIHSDAARDKHLAKSTQLAKAWRAAGKKYDNADSTGQARLRFERSWLYTLLLDFLDQAYASDISADQKQANTLYCERFLEFLCDLQSQLPTRRYTNVLLQDLNVLPAVKLSPLYDDSSQDALVRDMYQLLSHYTYFPVDSTSGKQLSRQEYEEAHNARITSLQQIALTFYAEKLKILYLANFSSLSQRKELLGHLESLTDEELRVLCRQLSLRTEYPEKTLVVQDRAFLLEVVAFYIERKPLYTDRMQTSNHILPTDQDLYDTKLTRADEYNGTRPLALPKLNLQFLTIGDFLWRSFTLFRGEAFYEIRKHLQDTIKRLQPRVQGTTTKFDGFSRMAIPVGRPGIIDVAPARVGEEVPAEVRVEVVLDVSRLQPGLRREWESLKPDDVVFLLAVQPNDPKGKLTNGHKHDAEKEKSGLNTLRCAEVINVLDENGKALRRDQDAHDHVEGLARPRQRRLILRLDAAAYKKDKECADAGKGDVYEDVNLIIRRKARENNFKAVLESIRQLAVSDVPLPTWLHEVFLGFGDPASASYTRLSTRLKTIDYRDTFLDWQHLIESTIGKVLEPDANAESSFSPPYVLESAGTAAPPPVKTSKKRRRDQPDGPEPAQSAEIFKVSTYKPPNTGPYPTDAPKLNTIRFTPSQVDAITSGTQPGLTMIVGPPGTGKTDVATQIISNIYHNFPQQRTLLIAHSNQALNQLFQKIVALDIDARHLLRLGHGEEELKTDASFSKAGRVDSFLERGGQYLQEVQRLAASIGAPGAHGSSCETAEYFDQVYIKPRWKGYWDSIADGTVEDVAIQFPFGAYYADVPVPLFQQAATKEEALEIARGCERHIRRMFDELADIRPFEILRAQKDKSNYLLVKEARIIAMTSTHAAMRRSEIASLGFHYDNVIMEEAAQITEVESFIPFVLQTPRQRNTEPSAAPVNPVQRLVLIGDHLQNAPIVQHPAYKSHARLSQPLFARLIRLGVPHILLDAQGRSRPSLAALYKWRYPKLTNLPLTTLQPEFLFANAGFKYDHQFISVPDYKGKGETEPSPHFLQNLGEAEYAVALYQYMRLLGYPASKITLLTPYAGQAALLRDIIAHRCKDRRLFGPPAWVGTVDKYQGEQNDYVILSLVRTKGPGYLRDLRRVTVALSRARLGLYVLGRREVFESSLELREAFAGLLETEEELEVVPGEMWGSVERGVGDEVEGVAMEGVEHLGKYVYEMTNAKVEDFNKTGNKAVTGEVEEFVDGDGGEDVQAEGGENDEVAA